MLLRFIEPTNRDFLRHDRSGDRGHAQPCALSGQADTCQPDESRYQSDTPAVRTSNRNDSAGFPSSEMRKRYSPGGSRGILRSLLRTDTATVDPNLKVNTLFAQGW